MLEDEDNVPVSDAEDPGVIETHHSVKNEEKVQSSNVCIEWAEENDIFLHGP